MDYKKVYDMAFSHPSYSNEEHIQYKYVQDNIQQFNLPNNKIIEIGSGRGQNLQKCIDNKDNIQNLILTSVDLNNYHNMTVDTFIKADLSKPDDRLEILNSGLYDILICTDVFEHLDKRFIEDVIELCAKLAKYSIIAIANHSDIHNGIELHTIQESDTWWDELLKKHFTITDKQKHYGNRLYMYKLVSNCIVV
jgi:2-polyprenyl-3-methyl-5-hydroxy-6-metoxy-1,4-benzoquinol methylase